MISTFDILILGGYLLFLASIGAIFRRFNRGSQDYFAGGFRMNWWMLGASSFISNFSCWLFTGAANIAYTYGILIFGFFLIDAVGFLVAYLWFAPRFRMLRLVTAMDAIRLRFGRASEQFFTWLYFASSLGIAAVWMMSLSIILSSAFHFPPVQVIGVTGAVVVFIALLGGNWAVVASDFIQLLVLLGVTTVASVLTVMKVGGPSAFLAQVPRDRLVFFHRAGSIPYDWLYLVTGLISASYMKNNIMYASKYIAAKDERQARRSVLIPLVGYILMPLIWFIPPLAAFTLVPELASSAGANPGEAAYILVVLKVLPTGLIGLLIGGMFSATIASMDVALNKNAGFFVKNFYQPILRPRAGDRELLRAGEVSTILFGVIITASALGMAVGSQVSLFDTFLYMNAYLGVPLSIPLFLGMFVKNVPRWSGWATTLCGIAMSVFVFLVVPTDFGRRLLEPILGLPIYSYLVTNKFVITHLVGVPVTMLFFLFSKFWYRADAESAGARATADFFARMRTPVNFELEVGGDNTRDQARILGKIACAYGLFVALLLGIPNPWSGRVGIAACATFLLGVGITLWKYSRWKKTGSLPTRPQPVVAIS